jgi:hypothetical protein
VDGQIGLAVSVVSAMTLGIVVDDTVHFLNRYTNARANGAPAKEAVLDVFATVGTAIWVTSAVLILGFSMLILSHFEVNGDMGFVTALTILFALIADLFFLPPLLLRFGGSR